MHLTLKVETTKPAGSNFLLQQAKFDDFIDCYSDSSFFALDSTDVHARLLDNRWTRITIFKLSP
jgi:hypothetical protein